MLPTLVVAKFDVIVLLFRCVFEVTLLIELPNCWFRFVPTAVK